MADGEQSRVGVRADAPRRSATLGDRVAFVRDLAEKLTGAGDQARIGAIVSAELRAAFGVSAVIMNVLSEDGSALTTLVADGVARSTRRLLAEPLPLTESSPAIAALRRGPILWPSVAARDREFPDFARYPSTSAAWAVLPLTSQEKAIGALSLGWPEPRRFGRVEVAILEIVAHQCALAVDRARIDAARRAERDTLELLAEGTRLMVSALEPETVLNSLVQLAVPRLAPWCAVYVADGPVLRRVAVDIDGDPELARALRDRADVPLGAETPVAATFRSGIGRVIHPIDPTVIRSMYPEPYATRILEHGSAWTGLVVPVRALGSVIGVMSLVSPGWGPTPPDVVVFGAEGLASRAGVALSNARRFQDERETAALLMQAFLPADLPAIAGYDVAARYLPAGSRVAGDWYDVALLPDGLYLVGIGDAGGHGLQAASLMGQLRNTARGLATTGHSPTAVIEALHMITTQESGTSFATASYGVLDAVSHTLHWASAGHLPPLEYGPGTARFADEPPSPPLGWPAGPVSHWEATLKRKHGIVLVTDGVVERRGADIASGMEALRALVASNTGMSPERLSRLIVERLAADPEDDCCVVVLKRR